MPGSFSDELRSAVGSFACTFLRTTSGQGFLIPPNPAPFAAPGIAPLSRWAYRNFCNREPDPPPPAPFEGGQCDGVLYVVSASWISADASGTPFPGTEVSYISPPLEGPITQIGSGPNPQVANRLQYLIKYDSGLQEIRFGNVDTTGPVKQLIVTDSLLVRSDGLPDDCGNPPPIYPSPDPNDVFIDVDITYTDDDLIDITIPVTITIAPSFIAGDLSLSIPFQITSSIDADLNINGSINLNTGDIDLNFSPKITVPGLDGSCDPLPFPDSNPPDFPDGVPSPDPENDPDEIPSRIIGVVVTSVVEVLTATEIFQTDNPNIFAPRLGNIAFYVDLGGVKAWTEDIPVRNLRQYIECPVSGGAIAVGGTPAPGVSWELTPIYAQINDPIVFG